MTRRASGQSPPADRPAPYRPQVGPAEGQLLRAILPTHSLRAVVALTTDVAREAARRQGAVGAAATALARGATAAVLMATLTKDEEKMTAELKGDGPLGTLLVDANAAGDVRAYLKNPSAQTAVVPGIRVSLGRALGRTGIVRVARDLGLREIVSGQTPFVDGEIDTDLEHYLDASEQVPSALGADALLGPGLDIAVAGGVLLQTLPGSDALPLLEEWKRALRGGALTRALHALPPGAADPMQLVQLLLAQHARGSELFDDLVALDRRPLRFHCPCSQERARATLALLSLQDLREMDAAGDGAEVTCEFCRARHGISPDELREELATKLAARSPEDHGDRWS